MPQKPPYTVRLWVQSLAPSGPFLGPLVPPGVRWVVRSVDLLTPRTSFDGVGPWYLQTSNGQILMGWGTRQLQGASTYSWEGRQVLEAGEQLQANSITAGFSWSISGFSLLLA